MKLHIHPFSQHARRVLMLCEELGIKPEITPVALETGEHKTEAFMALNPTGQVPVLEEDGFVLPESHAIMKYLATTKGGEAFYPAAPRERAAIDRWLDWNHVKLNPPVQTNAIHTMFMGESGDPELMATSREKAASALDVLEGALPAKAGIGGAPTLADLSVASTLALYEMSGGDLSGHPVCAAWFENMKARAGFQRTAPQMG